MNLRKIAVVGGFAVGAAVTLAPLASADITDITTTVDSEITSLNSMFVTDATLFGVGSDLVAPSAVQPFETISLLGAPDTAPANAFDYLLYGLNPIANASGDPGAYDLFNGALVEFDNAYNVELFSLLNPDVAINTIPLDDLFGSSANITAALATDTVTGAVGAFLTDGWNDLLGYL
jgi:hypothetical protein